MGTLKDVVDLTKELVERTQNREFAADLREIQTMIAAIGSENAELIERNIQLTKKNEELKRTADSLKEKVETLEQQVDSSHPTNSNPIKTLSAEEEQILKCLAEYEELSSEAISGVISIGGVKTRYWLDKLKDRRMISQALAIGQPPTYYLARDGRDYLVENERI